jgi:hypothetical protein
MMSLYLKALEGERGILPKKQHLLPSLTNNIKCGNSLIGYDILEGKLFDDDTKSRINPFDWNSKSVGFGEIMASGGFDVVIGNPPYVRQETIGEFKEYFQGHYEVYQGTADLYAYFIEKGVSLLKDKELFSYIVANKWMRANYGEPLRRWLKKQRIEEIIDFGDLPVFETATTYPCIIRIKKTADKKSGIGAAQVKTLNFNNLTEYVAEHSFTVEKKSLDDKGWSLVNEQAQALLNKLQKAGITLGDYVKGGIYRGVLTGLNEAFVIDAETKNRLIAEDLHSAELIKPFLLGRDVKRYQPPENEVNLILMPNGWTREHFGKGRNAWNWIKENYPAVANHLQPYADKAEKRFDKGEYWWELRACDYYEEFKEPKIIYPNICKKPEFTFDSNGLYTNQKCFIIPSSDKYLLGLRGRVWVKSCEFGYA